MVTTVISFIVILGILIFIHELGHFAVAKLCGVGVQKFSLGFGPKVLGVKWGETEYMISILPLGGYVKMVGEALGDDLPEEDRNRSFTHKCIPKKVAIVAAGPIMNLLFALFMMPLVYVIGIQMPSYLEEKPIVGYVDDDSAAWQACIQKGDIINEVDGKKIKNWEELTTSVLSAKGNVFRIMVEHEGRTFHAELALEGIGEDLGGLYPPMDPVVGAVSKGYPAEEAGIRVGDRIVGIDGTDITHWIEVQNMLRNVGSERTILIEREGREFTFQINPKWQEQIKGYIIGISPSQNMIIKDYGFFEAIPKGVRKVGEMTALTFMVIKRLFSGQLSIKALGGPIQIAQVAGQAAESGVTTFLFLMAYLSLQLGILNLFPFPVLDGGHLFFFTVEGIMGKPLNERVMIIMQQVGIVLLLLLMFVVSYNDVLRYFGK